MNSRDRRPSALRRRSTSPDSEAAIRESVRQYFEHRYPGRRRGRHRLAPTRLMFRSGEGARLEQLHTWLGNRPIESLLDVGCGDGLFAAELFADSPPARVRVEDLVASNTRFAALQWAERGAVVEAYVGDSFHVRDSRRYDAVLCCGVFDYLPDWPLLTRQLLQRTGGALMLDLPRAGTPHSKARRLWLRAHGLELHSVGERELQQNVRNAGFSAEVVATNLHWLLRITPTARLAS